MFVFVPAGQGWQLHEAVCRARARQSGIKVIGPGDVMDDDLLRLGDAALGTGHRPSVFRSPSLRDEQGIRRAYKKAFGSRRASWR